LTDVEFPWRQGAEPGAGMVETPAPTPSKSRLWGFLTSIRLTVPLLLLLAAVAVIGTVVPQEQPPDWYLGSYGQTLGSIITTWGLGNIYFSPWFLAPLGLLALNISACLVHGLPRALKRCFTPFSSETALALPERGRFTWPAAVEPHVRLAALLRAELGGRFRQVTLADQEIFLVERGRFRPLGPYLVHLAILLILAGGLIGKFWGVEGSLPLAQGEVAQDFLVGSAPKPLNFAVRLDKFQVEFYQAGGAPKEFRSDLTFLRDGREVRRAVCRVNEPVSFGGLTFYQASYGAKAAGPVRLKIGQGRGSRVLELRLGQVVDLPEGRGQLMLVRVEGDLNGYGPAAQLAFRSGPEHPMIFWVLKNHPELGEQPGPNRFQAEAIPFSFYSVFQVKSDPGVWWVYSGFILVFLGLYLAFFRLTARWAVVLTGGGPAGWTVRLLGASSRHREEFAATLERLLAGLAEGTPS
jgi:cytochrome c biogenesis protein